MHGPIPFFRFMELALYCPVYGYYEKEGDTIGRRGDFFTSVSVGSLFGELLGYQFAEWLEMSPIAEVGDKWVQIVEAGAHRGTLAQEVLGWIRRWRPALSARLEYWIVEPSARRQEWQRKTLAAFSGQVRWTRDLPQLSECQRARGVSGVQGIIFCNELLDAMPLRRFGWDAAQRCWFEWGVALADEGFEWTRMPVREPAEVIVSVPGLAGLLEVLPDGFTVERSPAAEAWWRQAAKCLMHGKLLAIDYGFTDEELLIPERVKGSLRAYRAHHSTENVLACPGEQDITAHVNFGTIKRIGEAAGLSTEALVYQSQFLTPLAASAITDWSPELKRQFQTLTHPEHLGHAFRLLVQSRSAPVNS